MEIPNAFFVRFTVARETSMLPSFPRCDQKFWNEEYADSDKKSLSEPWCEAY